MKPFPLILGLTSTALTVSACVSPVGAVRQAMASAPEWYQEARVEIRGEGYPDVSRVVGLEANRDMPQRVEETRLAVADAEALLLAEITGATAEAELAEALAWAETQQAAFVGLPDESEFLSEADLEALRALFNVRRAQP